MSDTNKPRPRVFWMGTVPRTCQLSGRAIIDTFVDGSHPVHKSWACWHPDAFAEIGGKLGPGTGQQYTRQADGRWMKTGG